MNHCLKHCYPLVKCDLLPHSVISNTDKQVFTGLTVNGLLFLFFSVSLSALILAAHTWCFHSVKKYQYVIFSLQICYSYFAELI